MAKKRSCRRTADQDKLHEKAVKLRKMTDEQLINYVEDRVAKAESEGYNRAKKECGETNVSNEISRFLGEITCLQGIGSATVNKMRTYAYDKGYIS